MMARALERPHFGMYEDKGPGSLYAHVRELMKDLELWHFHARNSIGSAGGWPDLVIIGPRGVLFRELKATHGIVSADQLLVGGLLAENGLNWAVWRPKDLLGGTIAAELLGISRYAAAPLPAPR